MKQTFLETFLTPEQIRKDMDDPIKKHIEENLAWYELAILQREIDEKKGKDFSQMSTDEVVAYWDRWETQQGYSL